MVCRDVPSWEKLTESERAILKAYRALKRDAKAEANRGVHPGDSAHWAYVAGPAGNTCDDVQSEGDL